MRSVQERQVCLEAMGIQQWYARSRLPGASATPIELLSFGGADNDSLALAPPLPTENDAASPLLSAEDAQSALDILKKGGLKPEPDSVPDTSRAITESSSLSSAPLINEVVPDNSLSELPVLSGLTAFSLVAYRSEKLVVLSESEIGGSHPSELELLKNILKAKAELSGLARECHYHQTFNWPVFASLNLQSKQSQMAAQLLSEWFAAQISSELQMVLYFGSVDTELGSFFQKLTAATCASQRFVRLSYSLSDMLRVPTRKSDVWAQLCKTFA